MIFFKTINKTWIITIHFTRKYCFNLSTFTFILSCFSFLCNYLWKLLAIYKWKLFPSKSYTKSVQCIMAHVKKSTFGWTTPLSPQDLEWMGSFRPGQSGSWYPANLLNWCPLRRKKSCPGANYKAKAGIWCPDLSSGNPAPYCPQPQGQPLFTVPPLSIQPQIQLKAPAS